VFEDIGVGGDGHGEEIDLSRPTNRMNLALAKGKIRSDEHRLERS
jgi:hypothetical protein